MGPMWAVGDCGSEMVLASDGGGVGKEVMWVG